MALRPDPLQRHAVARRPGRGQARGRGWALAALALALLMPSGCDERDQLSDTTAGLTKGGPPSGPVAVPIVQARVLTFENTFIGTLRFACDRLISPQSTLEERIGVLNWKIDNATAAIQISSDKNPVAAAIDFKVLVALGQTEVLGYWQKHYQAKAKHLIESYAYLQTEADEMLQGVLSPAQLTTLDQLIARWRADHPTEHAIAAVRLTDFADSRGEAVSQLPQSSLVDNLNVGGVFKLIGLDPMSGLDPAVDQIAQARAFAETAVRNLQRMPMLLDWQVQLMAFEIMSTPELRQILSDADHLTVVADQAMALAKGLPEQISQQREAVFKELNDASVPLATLLGNTKETLVAAGISADKITALLVEVGALTKALTPAPAPPGTPPPPPSKPFDILEYQQTLLTLGQSAVQLQQLVKQVHDLIDSQGVLTLQNQAQLALASAQATSDRLFMRLMLVGLALIGAMTGGLILALVIHRRTRPAGPRAQPGT